eukprot:403373420
MNPLIKVLLLLGVATQTYQFSLQKFLNNLAHQDHDHSYNEIKLNKVPELQAKPKVQKKLMTVGILTQPTSASKENYLNHSQYIFEMGDIWMRSAGLNAVYIPYNITDADLYPLLESVNGIFFTGGGLDLYNYTTWVPHPYTVTAEKIFNYTIAQNDKGIHFPILGVCQGHQLLHLIVAQNPTVLGNSELENKRTNTIFTVEPKKSKIFSTFSKDVIQAMNNTEVLLHLHHHAISQNAYFMNPSLIRFFNAATENIIDDQIIITTAEAQNYPIYSVQYHPEAVLEPSQDINATRSLMGFKIAQ